MATATQSRPVRPSKPHPKRKPAKGTKPKASTKPKAKPAKVTKPKPVAKPSHYADVYAFVATNPLAGVEQVIASVPSAKAVVKAAGNDADAIRKARTTIGAAVSIGNRGHRCAVALGLARIDSLPGLPVKRPASVKTKRIAGVVIKRPDALGRLDIAADATRATLVALSEPALSGKDIADRLDAKPAKVGAPASQARSVRAALDRAGVLLKSV